MVGEDVLWDDETFRQRVEAACKERGLSLREVLMAAGASRYYLNKRVEGRSTNMVMKLARELGMPPEELAFGITPAAREAAEGEVGPGLDVAGHFDADSLRRLIATMFTAQQVMALLYLALNQKEANLDTVADLIWRAAHGGRRRPAQESDSRARRRAAPSITTEPSSPNETEGNPPSPNNESSAARSGISAK